MQLHNQSYCILYGKACNEGGIMRQNFIVDCSVSVDEFVSKHLSSKAVKQLNSQADCENLLWRWKE